MFITRKKISSLLPSKKFAFRFLIIMGAAGIITATTLAFTHKKSDTEKSAAVEVADSPTLLSVLQKDSNGNGIPDWEEVLWGLDPKETYTPDGIRHDVYIQKRKMEVMGGIEPPQKELNETDKFARQFYASMVALKQSGQYDQDTIDGLALNFASQITNQDPKIKYSAKDIKVISGAGKKELKEYYNKVQSAYEKYSDKGIGDEIMLFFGGGVDKKDAHLAIAISDAYRNFAEEIVFIPVPSNLTGIHLDIVNSALALSHAVKSMLKAGSDPMAGFIGFGQYSEMSDTFLRSAEKLGKYMVEAGIMKDRDYSNIDPSPPNLGISDYDWSLIMQELQS